jgi:hypothetical protein
MTTTLLQGTVLMALMLPCLGGIFVSYLFDIHDEHRGEVK